MAAFAALAVSGCSISTSTPVVVMSSCMADRQDIVENVDWDTVPVTWIRIVDDNFRPMVMYLEKDRPYAIMVENADPVAHNIWAPGLLKRASALESVQIGDKAPAKGCVNGVRVQSHSTVTLRFVPVWEGRYEVYDTALPVIPGQLADGVIHIVPPRLGLASR